MIEGHTIVTGLSRSGKTHLCRKIAEAIKAHKRVLVLDTFGAGWSCDWQTTDAAEFVRIAKLNTNCLLVVDDGADTLNKHDAAFNWLGTQSRHWGHCFLINAQRYVEISPSIRNNAITTFAFKLSKKDAKLLSEDFADESLLSVTTLQKYEFLAGGKYKPFVKMKLTS